MTTNSAPPAIPLAPFPAQPKTLFLSGAGFNIYQLGGSLKYALEQLQQLNVNPDIYAGTSSGSFLALAMVLDYQIDDLVNWSVANYTTVAAQVQTSYWRAITTGALISESGKRRFIKLMIENSPLYKAKLSHLPAKAVTFKDLAEVTNKRLLCNATLITPPKPIGVLMSLWTSPDLPVHWAVMASMSLLGLFQPTLAPEWFRPTVANLKADENQTYKGYIDGGFLQDYLPGVFQSGTRAYYKNIYPQVDIPIDLNHSWGCLHNSQLTYENLQSGWSLLQLLQFFSSAVGLFYDNQLNSEPYGFLNQRTFQVTTPSRTIFPTIAEIRADYIEGYNQAKSQALDLLN